MVGGALFSDTTGHVIGDGYALVRGTPLAGAGGLPLLGDKLEPDNNLSC